MRYFISYSRKHTQSVDLAHALARNLRKRGNDVFLDVFMPVGDDWVRRIEQELDTCDRFVVLLSGPATESNMVSWEVRTAYAKRKREGRPHIFPVRVGFDGPLGYALDPYLHTIQYTTADSVHDVGRIVEAVGRPEASAPASARPSGYPTISGYVSAGEPHRDQDAPPAVRAAPVPSAPPRLPSPDAPHWLPTGGLALDDPMYVHRAADEALGGAAEATGAKTIVVKAPRQMGKTSLLLRYLHRCARAGKRVAYLNLGLISELASGGADGFRGALAHELCHELRLDPPESVADSSGPAGLSVSGLNELLEQHVLGALDGPLVLAMDAVDAIVGQDYQQSFLAQVRDWHNRRARSPEVSHVWARLTLVLVIAVEPYLLIDGAYQSPFNVSDLEVKPGPLSRGQCAELNGRFGAPLRDRDLEALLDLLGGHPFLTRRALRDLAAGTYKSLDELAAVAPDPVRGPFSDHLRTLVVRLEGSPTMLKAIRALHPDGHRPTDLDTGYRLHALGIGVEAGGVYRFANGLYARFFPSMPGTRA